MTVALTYNSESEPLAIVQEDLEGDSVITISLDGDPSPGVQAVTTPTLVVVYDASVSSSVPPALSVRRIVLRGSVAQGGRVDLAVLRTPSFPQFSSGAYVSFDLGLKYLGARPAGYYSESDPGDPVEPLGDPENPHAGKILVFEKPGDPLDTSLRDHTRLAIGVVEAIHGNNYPATIGVGQVFRVQAGTLGSDPVGDITADIFSSAPDGGVVPGEDSIGYVIAGNRIAGDIQSAGNLFRVAVGPSPDAKGLVRMDLTNLRIAAEGSVEQVFSTGPMGGGGTSVLIEAKDRVGQVRTAREDGVIVEAKGLVTVKAGQFRAGGTGTL